MRTYVKKIKDIDLTNMDETEIYQMLLDGKINRFPKNFIDCDDAKEYIPKIIRYLIEEVLKWDKETLKKNLRRKTFEDNKLAGILGSYYNSSPYLAIIDAYSENYIKPWELVNTPNSYWQGEEGKQNAINATKWLFFDVLKWNIEDIKDKVNHKVFIDNNLLGMLRRAFNASLWECINTTFPNMFKPWEIGTHVPNNYWTTNKGIDATRYLLETKLQWNRDDICKNYCKQIFKDNDLYGMIQRCFKSSPYLALNAVYPGEFQPFELKRIHKDYWNKETCEEAIRWLCFDKLKLSKEEAVQVANRELIVKNGLASVLNYLNANDIVMCLYSTDK